MTEAGLSGVTARPQYVTADERAQEAFHEEFKKVRNSGRRVYGRSGRPDAPTAGESRLRVVS